MELPQRKTLNGKFDAHCHVCWQAVYCLWVDDVDPAGACIEGALKIGDCKQASSWERTKGEILSYLKHQDPPYGYCTCGKHRSDQCDLCRTFQHS